MAGEVGKEPLREERKSVGEGEERVGGSFLFNSATLGKHPFVTGTMLRSGQKQLFPQREVQGGPAFYFPNYSHVILSCVEWRYECRKRGGNNVSAGGRSNDGELL